MRKGWAFLFFGVFVAMPYSLAETTADKFIVEISPGETREVTEAEKFAMKRKGVNFVDVTAWPDTAHLRGKRPRVPTYPIDLTQGETVNHLQTFLDPRNLRRNLDMFTSFNNRYYQSNSGNLSVEWLFGQVKGYVEAGSPVEVSVFKHAYRQSSIVATIPGKSTKTIVVGAHMDSINGGTGENRTTARAPGADDNGSGSMTILEAYRTLLLDDTIASGQAEHPIEFHWYAAEEVGLLGSSNIFYSYADVGKQVAAMLNQDMTGYTAGYIARNMTPKFGLVTDNVDASLTNFTRRIIDAYTSTEAGDTECGYGCSDHVSATRAGYPSAFVFEGEMKTVNDNPFVHTADDTIDKLDFEHMLEHARLVVGWVLELAFAKLD